jgi:putative tricarboxylic transport membrane protein
VLDQITPILGITFAGIATGLFTGLVPSLGTFPVLCLLYVFLLGCSPLELMVFYLALLTVSQYVDAIPAVYLGIPGELSAIPTAYESKFISDAETKQNILKWSALSRTVACIAAVLLTWALLSSISKFTVLFSVRVQLFLFALALVGILITGQNRWYVNIGLMLLGYTLGIVGYNWYLGHNVLTFGWTELQDGFPLAPMAMGLYVIPSLWKHMTADKKSLENCVGHHTAAGKQNFDTPVATTTRSGIIGYLLGLVPGTSFVLSGNASYNFEKWIKQRKGKYTPGNVSTAVACETGNQTGAFSSLIPLLYFGIPITAGESLIFDLMLQNGAIFQSGSFLLDNWISLVGAFIIVVATSVALSWPLAKYCLVLFRSVDSQKLFTTLIIFCILTTLYQGYSVNSLMLYSVTLLLAMLIGFAIRNFDVLPALFVLILQSSIETSVVNFFKVIN